ncbi:MAG: DAK2 domain-containing protein [Firmicutes bacterium]|nr:DAK2 domain-containing protein [Bacillota bacterium]
MYLTLTSAVQEVSKARDMSSIGEVSEAAARGALMGARGNSGVILSQLLRGLAQGLKNMDKISGKVFAQGLEQGVKVAFKAIMKPVEGTILTVAREAAREAVRASKNNSTPVGILRAACLVGEETLNRTPEMLPILKEAGVVDAGGMGWLVILEGFLCGLEESRPGVPALRGDSDSSRAAALGKYFS